MITTGRIIVFIVMLLSSAGSVFAAVQARRTVRKVRRAAPFAMMALSASFWMLFAGLEVIAGGLLFKEILWRLIPFAILNTVTGLFFFSLEFSLRLNRVPKSIFIPSIVIVLLASALAFTNHLHRRMWTVAYNGDQILQIYGDLFWVQLFFTYLFAGISLVLLIRAFFLSTGALKKQTSLLLIGILVPILVSVASDVFYWNPVNFLDEPSFSIIFAVIVFGWTTLRFNDFYLLPVASDTIIRNMKDGVLVTDLEGLILYSNIISQKLFGKKETELYGQFLEDALPAFSPDSLQAWHDKKDGVQLAVGEEPFQYYRFSISPLGSSAETIGYLLMFHENTDQMKYQKELSELAMRDALTGCYNRRYFQEMVGAYFDQMMRSMRPLSILMIDLDHFKRVNDDFGHAVGDEVLERVGVACKKSVRSQDIVARYGGEEFVFGLPDTSLQNALVVAERIRKAIETIGQNMAEVKVTASIGVAETAGEKGLTLDALIKRADDVMYQSKQAGGNRIATWKAA